MNDKNIFLAGRVPLIRKRKREIEGDVQIIISPLSSDAIFAN